MADAPENSIEAFTRALAHGATGLESDVRRAATGEPVLVHDPVVRSGLRRVRVADTALDRLVAIGVVPLATLYEAVGTDYELSLDAANLDAGLAAVEVARDAGAAARLWVCSRAVDVLVELRARAPEVHLVHSTRSHEVGPHERHAADLGRDGIDAVNFRYTDWSLGLATLYHRFGVRAFAWDAQEVRHVRALIAMGVDAIYSDFVDRLVSTVAEFTTT